MQSPKPRIRIRYGIWYCGVTAMGMWIVPPYGHGRTPAEAYADWKAQQ
jgi:hypothetical protein